MTSERRSNVSNGETTTQQRGRAQACLFFQQVPRESHLANLQGRSFRELLAV
jgi:hypothetical protein